MTSVKIGDPEHSCSSFTRFVLPFAYKVAPDSHADAKAAGPCFREASTSSDWIRPPDPNNSRYRYFTAETAYVLYRHAKWFVLENDREASTPGVWKRLTLELGGAHLEVALREPALVLFEYQEPRTSDASALLRSGLLIIEAFFPDTCSESGDCQRLSLAQVLEFNQLFRYWRKPYDEHKPRWLEQVNEQLEVAESSSASPEDGAYSGRWRTWLKKHLRTSSNKSFSLRIPESSNGGRIEDLRLKDFFDIYADDRAFVATCVFLTPTEPRETCAPLKAIETLANSPDSPEARSDLGAWVWLLNVDPPPERDGKGTWDATRFEHEWVRNRSYLRWGHRGTVYGFTPHSIALLAALTPHNEPPLAKHFGQHYFDTTLLLVYLRVTLFRFSRELAAISGNLGDTSRKADDAWVRKFNDVHAQFTQFENLYQFPLLSNQQQSIEMYSHQRAMMDIDALYEEVKSEIATSDEMLDTRLNNRRSESAERLNLVLAVGVILGLAMAWLAVPRDSQEPLKLLVPFSFIFLLLLGGLLLASACLNQMMVNVLAWRSRIRLALAAVFVLLAVVLLCLASWCLLASPGCPNPQPSVAPPQVSSTPHRGSRDGPDVQASAGTSTAPAASPQVSSTARRERPSP